MVEKEINLKISDFIMLSTIVWLRIIFNILALN